MITEERLRELWDANNLRTGVTGPQAFARAVEREAYEAAAKVCDDTSERSGSGWAANCAAAIRALAGEKP